MTNLLLWISAVDRALLARAPRETAKYVGIGGAVLMTATLAGISMSYALVVALHLHVLAVVLGVLWGLAILNLDRWIITATKRQGRWYADIAMALPRLVLAIVIGAVISEPLVLRVFQGEIASQVAVDSSRARADFARALDADTRYAGLPMAKTTLTDLQERISRGVGPAAVVGDPAVRQAIDELAQVRKDLAAAEAAIACEGSGTCGSGTAGDGPVFRENQARRDRLAAQNSELTEQVNTLKAAVQAREQSSFASQRGPLEQERDRLATDINRLTEAKRAELKEHDARVDDADGLLARISALGHLTKENESMRTARWALFLFILLIECMPVLVKVLMNLSKPSHYDLLLQAQDEQDLKRERLRWATSMEEAQMQALLHSMLRSPRAAPSSTRTSRRRGSCSRPRWTWSGRRPSNGESSRWLPWSRRDRRT